MGGTAYFKKEVDLDSREAMIGFLRDHFRYDTMNSWNRSTSYANKVKIYSLGLTDSQERIAYDILDVDGALDEINEMLWEWDESNGFQWQVGFNGRSGGYLVLYRGGVKDGRVFTLPGRGTDFLEEADDIDQLGLESLREYTGIVSSFDDLCDRVRDTFIDMCDTCVVEEEVVHVPKKVKVLRCKEETDAK